MHEICVGRTKHLWLYFTRHLQSIWSVQPYSHNCFRTVVFSQLFRLVLGWFVLFWFHVFHSQIVQQYLYPQLLSHSGSPHMPSFALVFDLFCFCFCMFVRRMCTPMYFSALRRPPFYVNSCFTIKVVSRVCCTDSELAVTLQARIASVAYWGGGLLLSAAWRLISV